MQREVEAKHILILFSLLIVLGFIGVCFILLLQSQNAYNEQQIALKKQEIMDNRAASDRADQLARQKAVLEYQQRQRQNNYVPPPTIKFEVPKINTETPSMLPTCTKCTQSLTGSGIVCKEYSGTGCL